MAPITNPILEPRLRAMVATPDTYVNTLIRAIISILLLGGVLIFILFFILGAFKLITSQGDKGTIEKGQQQLTYAFLGLAISFCLFAILKLLGHFFGVTNLENLQLNWPSM